MVEADSSALPEGLLDRPFTAGEAKLEFHYSALQRAFHSRASAAKGDLVKAFGEGAEAS